MKNITVSVSDELYHTARLRAAERRSTVSALVRGFLEQLTNDLQQLLLTKWFSNQWGVSKRLG